MGIFSRFFGKKDKDGSPEDAALVVNPDCESKISLQLLLGEGLKCEPVLLTKALRAYHPSMARARVEIDMEGLEKGNLLGLAGWGKHVIRLVGFDAPMPREAVETCVAPSHYGQELKERARAHNAHVLFYYNGYDDSPLEQYVALAAFAGVLAKFGALVVLNETAHTSFPAAALAPGEKKLDMVEQLRTLPLPALYCGFVKYEVEGTPGVWMRTYGAHLFGLPDFAVLAKNHDEGQKYFNVFDNILNYMKASGAEIEPGHTTQVGPHEYFRFRAAESEEWFLEAADRLLVAEVIGPEDIRLP